MRTARFGLLIPGADGLTYDVLLSLSFPLSFSTVLEDCAPNNDSWDALDTSLLRDGEDIMEAGYEIGGAV